MGTDSACFVIVQVFAGILRLLSLSRKSLKGCHHINKSISAKNKHIVQRQSQYTNEYLTHDANLQDQPSMHGFKRLLN